MATEFFASEMEWNGGSVGSVIGAENYTTHMRQFFETLPDVYASEQEVLEDGDKVAMWSIFFYTILPPSLLHYGASCRENVLEMSKKAAS